MKKLLILLLLVLLLSACNQALCPAYNDSANDMKNTLTQKGNFRADGIDRVYRDANHRKR
jgi:hypothetical protein